MTKQQESAPKSEVLAALHAVMGKVGYVQKKGQNKFHHYRYAGEGDLLEALRPAMVEAGLLLIPSVREVSEIDSYGNINVTVDYTLAHKNGEVWPEKITVVGTGNDKNSKGGVGDKGTYKAMTGANKYLLFKLFQIETGDDPEKKETAEPGADAEKPTEPHAIDVPAPTNGGMKDVWEGWCQRFIHAIDACEDVSTINAWIHANEEPFKSLHTFNKSAHAHVDKQIKAKVGKLVQAPLGAAAE